MSASPRRKILRHQLHNAQITPERYRAALRPQPSRPGLRYHPTKGFRKEASRG